MKDTTESIQARQHEKCLLTVNNSEQTRQPLFVLAPGVWSLEFHLVDCDFWGRAVAKDTFGLIPNLSAKCSQSFAYSDS